MKRTQTSPFSSPKCQLTESISTPENGARIRPRRKPAGVLDESIVNETLDSVSYGQELTEQQTNCVSIRRTRTVPTTMGAALANEAERAPFPERRRRRNLSKVFTDDLAAEELLADSGKRVCCSARNLKINAVASEKSLAAILTKRGAGRPATPLDIPFYPSSSISRAVSAEYELDSFENEIEVNKVDIRRTRTQIPPTYPSASNLGKILTASDRPLRSQRSLTSQKSDSIRNRQNASSSNSSLSIDENNELESEANDSAQDLQGMRASERKLCSFEKRVSVKRLDAFIPYATTNADSNKDEISTANNIEEQESHTITIDRPSRKGLQQKDKSSKKLGNAEVKRDEVKTQDAEMPKLLTWWQLFFHYVSLIFVQYPFRHHKQWLDKMHKAHRLPNPRRSRRGHQQDLTDWQPNSLTSNPGAAGVGSLPSLPENASFRAPARNARVRRRTQLDADDNHNDELNVTLGANHNKRTSSISGGSVIQSTIPNRPPPGHLPRSRNISVDRGARKKNRRSVEIFGDIMTALGLYQVGKARLKLPHGISEMDESELSGFQARFYNFIKRHHKGRLARAWDHMIHPLDSMQKKHRRSTNKTLLLNAIDKHKAQKFENNYDMVKTKFFLCGQWFFEALSPPRYTKKPMLLTVLFPLVLILFFGFMAGEYSYWRNQQGYKTMYKFGPEELSSWFLKSDPWRTFDDEFLIIWGARYLPRVTSESWRWLISMLVHESFAHLGGNLLLFVLLSWSLESKYGFWRTGLVCWLSGISGNFMSAAFEDSCGIVLGASGCVFGLAAFYIIDVAGDFKFVSFPCLRLIGISIFLCAFIIALTSHQEASHLSHIGGFLFGFCVSLVFVPRFIDERIEACVPWVAFIIALALLCVVPLVVFCSVLPNLECSS